MKKLDIKNWENWKSGKSGKSYSEFSYFWVFNLFLQLKSNLIISEKYFQDFQCFRVFNLTHFITKNFPQVISHHNQLKNYQNSICKIKDFYDTVIIDPLILWKSQSINKISSSITALQWKKIEIAPSKIMKQNGTKNYLAYLSDNTVQKQSFVNNVLQKMLSECDISQSRNLIVEIDNCTS